MTQPRCMALTRAGDQCQARAKRGAQFCGVHAGDTPIGRPTKLTRELANAIAELVRRGGFYEEVAVSAGIGKATLYRWLEEGEADQEHGRDTDAAYFRDALTRASAEAERMAAESVLGHRFTDWRAAAWYLERRNPGAWGKTDRVELSGSVRTGEPEVVAPSEVEQRERIARILREAGALARAEEEE